MNKVATCSGVSARRRAPAPIGLSPQPASDADCKKTDAQFGHQVALLAIVRRNAPQAMTFGQD
jgi:hypothetical protein